MFESLFRLCTGETLEIAQEMSIQNGDASMISNDDSETATAMILQRSSEDDDLGQKKLKNSRHKSEKAMKMKKTQDNRSNYAR